MLPVERTLEFFERVELPQPLDDADELVLGEIRSRLRYLRDVGLGYLTLDRQSRTLSGRRGAAHQPHDGARHRRSSTRCSCSTSRASACIRATLAVSSKC